MADPHTASPGPKPRRLLSRSRQLEILDDIGTAIASDLTLDDIVQKVTEAATELTGAQFGAFFYNVHDSRGESYLLYALAGAPRSAFEGFGMPRNTAIFDHTFRGIGVVRSNDIAKDPRYGKNTPHHGIPKGHLKVTSYLAVPVVTRSGEVIGGLFFGHPSAGVFTQTAEDIVVRIAARAAVAIENSRLLQAAQRLASIVESSDDAIISKDLDGIITSWNRGAERVFGYTAGEVVGRSVLTLIPPEKQDEEPEILRRIIGGERIQHYETIRQRKDGTKFNIAITVSPIRDRSNKIIGASKIGRDITGLKQVQEKRELLMREMNHRIKNLFAVASGIVAISARSAGSAKELARSVQERLTAMAFAHELTLPQGAQGPEKSGHVLLKDLAAAVLSPYHKMADGNAIAMDGPDVTVGPNSATNLALLLHEMGTNSLKYGALSAPTGRIKLDWTAGELIDLRWTEKGGPEISGPPDTEGFGGTLSKMTVASLGGEIHREWMAGGLVMHLKVPVAPLAL